MKLIKFGLIICGVLLFGGVRAKTVQVNFNPQPANGTLTVTYFDGIDIKIFSGDEVPVNSEITITAIPDEGYSLSELTVNGESIFKGEIVNKGIFVTETTNIVATFAANTYIITFDAQGGTVSPASQTVTYGTAVGTLPTPTLNNNTFGGWFTGTNGSGTQYTATTVYNTVGDITLYAKWTPIPPNTITASAGSNGTISPSGNVSVNQGDSQTFTFTPNTGYEIDQVLVDNVNNPAAVSSGSYTFSNVTANHTISVSFKAKQYTLTFDAKGGTVSPLSQTVTYGTAVGKLPTPTLNGNTFGGWWTAANGGGTQYLATTIYSIEGNITLYAKWEKITCGLEIEFERKGSNILICSVSKDEGIKSYEWGYITTEADTIWLRWEDLKNIDGLQEKDSTAYLNCQYIQYPENIIDNFKCFVKITTNENCVTYDEYIQKKGGNAPALLSPITAYPNPTKNHLSITLDKDIKGSYTVLLFNPFGQTVFTKQYAEYQNNDVLNIDFNLPPGIYFLTVKTKDEILTSKILIE